MRWRDLAVVGVAILVVAGVVGLQAQSIVGSFHDFSGASWSGGEICAPCHTPHNATAGAVPLWNHQSTTALFTLYSSPTLNARDLGQPSPISKSCLSCHDGTVALDSFGRVAGGEFVNARKLIGTDLSNDHPISFTYDGALARADGELYDPTATDSGLGGTIDKDLLSNHKIECTSCHDVHNTSGAPRLLVKSNAGSQLCLTCHKK
jgi:predicted CXXCH cytochrome family protein